MTPPVLVLTEVLEDDEIDARRRDLLSSINLDEEELRRRGEAYILTPEEAVVLRELENLDFLADS